MLSHVVLQTVVLRTTWRSSRSWRSESRCSHQSGRSTSRSTQLGARPIRGGRNRGAVTRRAAQRRAAHNMMLNSLAGLEVKMQSRVVLLTVMLHTTWCSPHSWRSESRCSQQSCCSTSCCTRHGARLTRESLSGGALTRRAAQRRAAHDMVIVSLVEVRVEVLSPVTLLDVVLHTTLRSSHS